MLTLHYDYKFGVADTFLREGATSPWRHECVRHMSASPAECYAHVKRGAKAVGFRYKNVRIVGETPWEKLKIRVQHYRYEYVRTRRDGDSQ